MFSSKLSLIGRVALGMWALSLTSLGLAQTNYPGIGRTATQKEITAWDIDVRPDFKGLPPGSGSVSKGMQVWEAKCASCHGIFGENNEVFSPLIGGTTKNDIVTGRVASLKDNSFPGRTTLMKVPHLSTLWDYINRAMPWTQPKTLTTEEVYAVTAYLLNLADVVPENFVLSHNNMEQVQKLLPNRDGMHTDHALWPGKSQKKPDVNALACMKNCASTEKVVSAIPDYASNAHGNLAEQNRLVGAQKGIKTQLTVPASAVNTSATNNTAAALPLLQKYTCTACHGIENKLVGPGFQEISKKYQGKGDAAAYLTGKIKSGSSGAWGQIPMPAQSLPDSDMKIIVQWMLEGSKK